MCVRLDLVLSYVNHKSFSIKSNAFWIISFRKQQPKRTNKNYDI